MRNATIHQVFNGYVVAFTHEKDVWEYVFTNFADVTRALENWFSNNTLPTQERLTPL